MAGCLDNYKQTVSMMGQTCLLTTLLVALCTSVCPVRGGPLGYCNDQRWDYTQEVLARKDFNIWDIAVSRHTGNIYVPLITENSLLVIRNKNATQNVDIEHIQCVAVDKTVPQVYVGSVNRLYIYNEVSGSVTKFTQVQHGAYDLFAPNHRQEVYVVPWGLPGVYRYRHNFTERTKIINDKVHRFVVDNDSNYFYSRYENNSLVTKVQLDGHDDTITFNDGPFHVLAVDNVGRVFGINNNYRTVHLLKTDGTTQEVAMLDFNSTRMSFDGDNNVVIGSYGDKIIKLKFNKCISPSTTESSDTTITSQDINTLYRNITEELQNVRRELETRLTTADKIVNQTLHSNNTYLESRLNSMEKELEQLLVSSRHDSNETGKERTSSNSSTLFVNSPSIFNFYN